MSLIDEIQDTPRGYYLSNNLRGHYLVISKVVQEGELPELDCDAYVIEAMFESYSKAERYIKKNIKINPSREGTFLILSTTFEVVDFDCEKWKTVEGVQSVIFNYHL